MPDTPKTPAAADQDGYQTDTFSRNDQEGRPGPELKPDPRSFEAGEEDGYDTDTFSRNDAEGSPGLEVGAGDAAD